MVLLCTLISLALSTLSDLFVQRLLIVLSLTHHAIAICGV